MLGFLNPVKTTAVDPFTDVLAADLFWRNVPRSDPITAQKAVCGALADLVARDRPDMGRLRALLALDRHARALVDALLVNYVGGNPQPSSVEMPSWQAAFELCRSFGRAHGQFLRSMRENPQFKGWRELLPGVTLRLFQHRQIELLLRPFVDERSTRFSWKELHETYRFAQSCGVLHATLPISRCHAPDREETTLEREYIQVLTQDLMNEGHFPPHDAFRASQSLPRWCREAALASHKLRGAEHGFVVDLGGDAGLARSTREAPGTCLGFDTTPVLASIRSEMASLRDASGSTGRGSPFRRGRQLRLLGKASLLCAPERPVIARRGERKPAALTVDVAIGLSQILSKLRNKPEGGAAAPRPAIATSDGETITGLDGFTMFPKTGFGGPSTVMQSPTPALDAGPPPLTMVDRSDSGCRLHGPTSAANPIVPGVLIAFRENAASPWTLAVVRRVKKRMAGKRIEIGVEYVGSDPRRIVVVVPDSDARPDRPAGSEQPRFAALFLPESAAHPVLPIKTLIMPMREHAPGDRLSVRSRAAVYTIRLKEPLEEQAEFVWLPFDILDRWLKNEPASAAVMAELR